MQPIWRPSRNSVCLLHDQGTQSHEANRPRNREQRIVKNVLTLILAGGKGTRLEPLTRDRAKPAVPFGGLYRIIDFPLSNCINSDLRRILVLTQYKARSLDRHIGAGWSFLSRELREFGEVLPPTQR